MLKELFLIGFLLVILAAAAKRPFLFILAYCYVDIVAPQRLSSAILPHMQLSLVLFALAVGTWLMFDKKRGTRFDLAQGLLTALLLYCLTTTIYAHEPSVAWDKWSWVWKALLWSIFLPLTLTTRLRIEALLLTMVLAAGTLALSGGLKTLAGGSGYGSLRILISDNSGLFEGSIFSTVAIATIPIILWLARYGTVFRPSRAVWAFAIFLTLNCLLIPIGTQARTGLLCAALLVLLGLRETQRRGLYLSIIAGLAVFGAALAPAAFSSRMGTIGDYKSDESASTRVAVWKWTWNYALDHPLGGGFNVYVKNRLQVNRVETTVNGSSVSRRIVPYTDQSRAFHNSYFEMLGEQGFPGLALWLSLQLICLVRMERLRRRFRGVGGDDGWIRPLAGALQGGQLVYLLGCMFVGIAFQPYMFMLLAAQIGLWSYARGKFAQQPWRVVESFAPPGPTRGFARG
mgnify:CR=1 FL=1